MALLLLFYLIVTATELPWPEPMFGMGPGGSAAMTAVLMALPVLTAHRLARRTRRRLIAEPFRRDEVLLAHARGKQRQLYLLMAAHLLALGLGWGWTAWRWDYAPPLAELLIAAPFLVGLALSWACQYPAERAAQETAAPWDEPPFAGRWGYVGFLARQYLALMSVPLLLFLVQQGLARTCPTLFQDGRFWAALLGVVVVALALAPWALKLILGLRPLAPGPIRARLEAAGRRLAVRYADILYWDTRHGVANAMVAGIVPRVRYVLLSDRLLADLTPDEVEAVFGHEAGHVRHGHMAFYALFLALSLAALSGVWGVAGEALWGAATAAQPAGFWGAWEPVPLALFTGLYVFVVFGFLSRRCERQADLFGCRAVSCGRPDCAGHGPADTPLPAAAGLCATGIRTFIAALEKVAVVNGVSRRRPGLLSAWLHGSIARRVEFLEDVLADRRRAASFQRRVGLLKWALLGVLVAALAALGWAGYGHQVWAGV